MNVILIIKGRKILEDRTFDFRRLSVLLADKDYEITKIIYLDDGDGFEKLTDGFSGECLFVVCGNTEGLREELCTDDSELTEYFTAGIHTFVPMPAFDENTVRNVVIPLLNAKCKTSYHTVIFKTFGKSESELREILREFLKNRNRISFAFPANEAGFDVRIKYSRGTPSAAITELIGNVNMTLGDCVYALSDISLSGQVARKLMSSGKKLCIAESFTGGGLAAALVKSPGMSNSLLESVVCYADEAKIRRLGVPEKTIAAFGAVSADTAFEMANGLLANPLCDIAVATTGNAGPTAERDGRVGLCYIAIGDRKAIHVFEQFYEVDHTETKSVDEIRREITDAGIHTALYKLGEYLKENSQENPNG